MGTVPSQWGYVVEQLLHVDERTSGGRSREPARRRRWSRHRGGRGERRPDLS